MRPRENLVAVQTGWTWEQLAHAWLASVDEEAFTELAR